METFWHARAPGQHSAPVSVAQGLDEFDGDEGCALLMGDLRVPDRLRLPDDCPIGPGEERKVIAHGYHGCPKHEPETWREPGPVLHLEVAPGGVFVAECVSCGFVVFALGSES